MSIFEMALLAITIFILLSIVWSTLRLGISPMPSSRKARLVMMQLCDEAVDQAGDGPIVELGSGWGNVLIALGKQYPQRIIVGYELSILPWLVSVMLIRCLGLRNVQVCRKNFLYADLRDAVIMMCYLFPAGMNRVEGKLSAECGALEYLISNNFALPSHKPVNTILLDDVYQSPVYLYQFK